MGIMGFNIWSPSIEALLVKRITVNGLESSCAHQGAEALPYLLYKEDIFELESLTDCDGGFTLFQCSDHTDSSIQSQWFQVPRLSPRYVKWGIRLAVLFSWLRTQCYLKHLLGRFVFEGHGFEQCFICTRNCVFFKERQSLARCGS